MLESERDILNAVSWNYAEWYNYGKKLNIPEIVEIEKQLQSQLSKLPELKGVKLDEKAFFIGFYEGYLFSLCLQYLNIRKEIRKIKEENYRGFFDIILERSSLFSSLI